MLGDNREDGGNAPQDEKIKKLLETMSYKPQDIVVRGDNTHLFLGIGLWSHRHGLSKGLPLDVLYLLIYAKLAQALINSKKPENESVFTILIADSMAKVAALNSGRDALKNKINDMALKYRNVLNIILKVLCMQDETEIVFLSDIEETTEYLKVKEETQKKFAETSDPSLVQLREDADHFPYFLAQTAIVRYMYLCCHAGHKISWMTKSSLRYFNCRKVNAVKTYDELAFDVLYRQLYGDKGLQFLYTKAGLQVIQRNGGQLQIPECPPYIAYDDSTGVTRIRYILGDKGCIAKKPPAELGKGVKGRCNELMNLVKKLSIFDLICLEPSFLEHYNFLQHCIDAPFCEESLQMVSSRFFKCHSGSSEEEITSALEKTIITTVPQHLA